MFYSVEEKEDTLWWGANRSVISYCLPCAGSAAGAGQNEFSSENCHPSDDIDPAALENEYLGEKRSDNTEPACELTDDCHDAEYLHLPLIETRDESMKHTRARNFFCNTTSVTIRRRNSLLRCLSLDIFSSNKALVNLVISLWFSRTLA